MFLEQVDSYSKDYKSIVKFAKESSTFNAFYAFWREHLFERVMKLFIWENTETYKEDGITPDHNFVKPKEIEQRLLLAGHCGITRITASNGTYSIKDKLTAMYGTLYGVTEYLDEKTNYIVRCPIYTGTRTIGKDVVVIDNTSIRNPLTHLIHHYAILLGHTDVTLSLLLVNARDNGGVPIVTTEKQKQSVEQYQGRLLNGQYGTVTDKACLGIQYAGVDKGSRQTVMEVIEIREKLLKSFYSAIGVRSAFEKRNNTIMAEVEADTSLLQINISDMIKCRENACEQINKMFGTNWNVHIAEEIDYGLENERVQFDTLDSYHDAEQNELRMFNDIVRKESE